MNNLDINENAYGNKQKLNVCDYVFEIDNNDIMNVEVEYKFFDLTSVSFKDGKKDKTEYLPAILFDISGVDKDNNEAWFSFELDMSLEHLNTYSENPVDITRYLSYAEAFVKKPLMDHSIPLSFYLPTNTTKDIYHNLTSLWVVKKDVNIFIFKLCVPDENLFAFFEVNFNNVNE